MNKIKIGIGLGLILLTTGTTLALSIPWTTETPQEKFDRTAYSVTLAHETLYKATLDHLTAWNDLAFDKIQKASAEHNHEEVQRLMNIIETNNHRIEKAEQKDPVFTLQE